MGEALGLSSAQVVRGGGGGNPHGPGRAEERNDRDLTGEPSTTIPATQIGNAGPFVFERPDWWHRSSHPSRAVGSKANASVALLAPAPTVLAREVKGPGLRPDSAGASSALRRGLTVEECATLQGFPAGYRFHGTKTAQYRQVGNACVPAVVEALARAILAERDERTTKE
jgi:site-specific DNA-cytosine methylase